MVVSLSYCLSTFHYYVVRRRTEHRFLLRYSNRVSFILSELTARKEIKMFEDLYVILKRTDAKIQQKNWFVKLLLVST